MIQLHTLGTLDLRGTDGVEIRSVLAQPKRLGLLAYLAANMHAGFQPRDQVLALFWPDQDDEHARAALNRALYYLRHSLGNGVLLSRGDDAIGLSPDHFWCDAADFEVAAAARRWPEALELYRGEFLDGFHIPDSSGIGRWVEAKRYRLRSRACHAAWSLVDEERNAGNRRAAVQWAHWAVEQSPHDEASVQRLISLLDASGDRAGSVSTYEQFARRLHDELELTPAPETRALIASIRARQAVDADITTTLDVNGNVPARPTTVAPNESSLAAAETPSGARELETAAERRGLVTPLKLLRRRQTMALVSLFATSSVAFIATRPTLDVNLVEVATVQNRSGDATLDTVARMTTDWVIRSVADAVESTATSSASSASRVIVREEGAREGSLFARRRRAGIMVTGAIYGNRGSLRFHLHVTDATRGRRVWAVAPVTASRDSSHRALYELGQRTAGAVAALQNPALAAWFPLATAPPTHDALVEYERASSVQRPWDAGQHYARAAELDSTFIWALLEASWQGRMMDRGRAHAIVAELDRKRAGMTRLQTAVLNALIAREAGDRQSNYDALTVAAALAPARFLLPLAQSAWSLNLPRQSLRLLDRYQEYQPSGRVDATWWLRAVLWHELRQHTDELALIRRMRSTRPRSLNLIAMQASALAALGETAQVLALVDTALSLPVEMFDSPGTVMLTAADELRAHGQHTPAAQLTQRAIAWYRGTPATFTKANPQWHDYRLATALYSAGRLKEARPVYEKLVAINTPPLAENYGWLGAIAARSGNRVEAESYLTAIGNLVIPDEAQTEDVGLARARIAVLLGDTARAFAFLREGYGGGQGIDLHTDIDLAPVIERNRDFQEFVRPKG